MKQPISVLDVVALVEDLPEKGLVGGQVGTIVEVLAPGVFEVEFIDKRTGHPFAMLALRAEQLLPLRYVPVQPA